MQLRENIPSQLTASADAALAWINDQRGTQFRLTGLVDAEAALAAKAGEAIELGLVLCEGDVCLREQVRLSPCHLPTVGGFGQTLNRKHPSQWPT